jgi:hypothetical protein
MDAGPPVYCGHPSDCPAATICGATGTCQPGPCSTTNPCIYGYVCAGTGACISPTPNACDADASCVGGSLCIAGSDGKGGVCTPAAGQCFDREQCGTGEVCAAGKCTLACATSADCRDGFGCDVVHGICSVPAQGCTVTNDCGSATQVCVGGACVPRSNGGSCPTPGDVWTENGCIPNQAPKFVCTNDGVQDTCVTGSICLYHDCWISCDPPNQNACIGMPFPTCKPVVEGGTYQVCGSAQILGGECGPGSGNKTCTGAQLCIDGFCK